VVSFRDEPGSAKTYNRIKLALGVFSSLIAFLFLVILVMSGLTLQIERTITAIAGNSPVAFLIFVLTVAVAQGLLSLPVRYVSGYIVEHRYRLSNQSVGRWAWEHAKATMISVPLLIGISFVVFISLRMYGSFWWIAVGTVLTLLSVVLARLGPVLLLPLFYRCTPLQGGPLKERLLELCAAAGVHSDGIFSFNLSKNTKKANAGLAGIGRTRRIVIGDTLLQDFSQDEIEAVFAHELGHYVHHHIWIGIALGVVSTFTGLFITAQLYAWSLPFFGFTGERQIAALPLLAIWFSLFGLIVAPAGNILSRYHERQADTYAVRATGKRNAFVSALRRLATMNLADPDPHPLIEFLFYSHPSIARRIRMLESL
jgi:STE24 endopeptidase